jgi:EAL domain-containing protein (putative c-di-GMP-specific phosphodiesterase class I)
VDYIKIDGGFVSNMTTSAIDKEMVKAINQIADLMGKETIAEFVENDHILKELEAISVDYVQGYWIGEPMPLDEHLPADSIAESKPIS